ncbi:MAG: flavin monoamine oxidase family protein [Myxococcota bacterium]
MIVVVGAGMAGLAAGRALADAGREVVVLEARERIGGRIHTDRSLGTALELGAAWIHGSEGNAVLALAERLGARTVETRHGAFALYDGGRRLDDATVQAVQVRFGALVEEAKGLARAGDRPLADALRAAAEHAGTSEARQAVSWGLAWLRAIMGVELEGLSTRHWDQDEDLPGPDRVLPEGYDVVPRGLAEGLDVRCGEVVRRIEWDGVPVRVHATSGTLEPSVVVVTVPLGVLQSWPDLFDPPLPEPKCRAIGAVGMGVLDKVILRFPATFWPEACEHLGPVHPGPEEVVAFSSLVRYGMGPVLVGWLSGDQARRLEPLADDVIVGRALSALRASFGRSVPDPEAVRVTRWASDPFARGSYSHLPPGTDGAAYDELAEPVVGHLFFAGEHTHRAHPATTHGAYLSGLRAANQVLARLDAGKESE